MRRFFGVALVAMVALGCGSEGSFEDEGGIFVEEGKEDNFLSTTAQEYMVEGTMTVTLEKNLALASSAAKLKRVQALIPLKQIQVGWFLNQYLAEKEDDSSNKNYGGFSALTKNGAYEELAIEPVDDLTYRFTFRQEFGGPMDLLDKLPTRELDNDTRAFDLTIGKVSNDDLTRLTTNAEWYRSGSWSSFNPTSMDPSQLETVTLKVWAEPRSPDAWIDYNRLFADGKLTIGLHFGWDYHNNYHLVHSKSVYEWLVNSQGFTSPVASYDAYTRKSGPLTRTITANGKSVKVEIAMFWGKPGTDADPDTAAGGRVLEDDMRLSFKNREVILFSGHSGPFYGFALANWKVTDEGDLDDSEVASLDMPSDVYQVVLAEGCDTYALGENFKLNPAKAGAKNIDVITTTSFSNASTPDAVKDFLTAMIGTAGTHKARSYLEMLRDLENNSYWFNTMYGVHGLDDNPHAHPYADVNAVCRTCATNKDCGGEAMRCTSVSGGERFCTYFCTADDGCPAGFQCRPVAQGSTITSNQCVPKNNTCKVAPPVTGPALVINEVFAAPDKARDDADANGDGVTSGTADEFIELVNMSGNALDVSGWSVADATMQRLVFPANTSIPAGKALVVFGGGNRNAFASLGGAGVLVSVSKKLGLNNSGDTVTLKNKAGKVVDQMLFGAEGGKGRSLVRAHDGDATSAFVTHPDVTHSAGTRSDGLPY